MESMEKILDEVVRIVSLKLDGVSVEKGRTLKNNGEVRSGICIRPDGCSTAPVFYIDSLVEAGRTEADMAEFVIGEYRKHKTGARQMEGLSKRAVSYDACKKDLRLHLVGRGQNGKMLEDVPYKKFLDLAVIVAVEFPGVYGGRCVLKVSRDLLKIWGKGFDEVYGQALENFRMERTDIRSLGEILSGYGVSGIREGAPEMYVVTNPRMFYGAARLLDSGAMKVLTARVGDSFVMMPSSLHEVIIMPLAGGADLDGLSGIVREVNDAELPREEILSDHAYIYRKDSGWEY